MYYSNSRNSIAVVHTFASAISALSANGMSPEYGIGVKNPCHTKGSNEGGGGKPESTCNDEGGGDRNSNVPQWPSRGDFIFSAPFELSSALDMKEAALPLLVLFRAVHSRLTECLLYAGAKPLRAILAHKRQRRGRW